MSKHSTDYLIVGAGAVGLAFADTLLSQTSDTSITIVDKHGQPGGHWNDAYSFVALHQPSAFYGVNSLPLGTGVKDTQGVNSGLYELASGPEVLGYYNTVMRQKLLPSGRVHYLPMTEYTSEGKFRSLLTDEQSKVDVQRKVVDATYYGTTVPSTHCPKFTVEPDIRLVTPNALPHIARAPEGTPDHYTIIGAGKTAMDVAVWLLGAGVPASKISWVMPRDSWLLNRLNTQPGLEFFHEVIGGQAAQMEAFANSGTIQELFSELEAVGVMLRIDRDVEPTMFHYATISKGEVEALRTIKQVIRKGHVQSIGRSGMTLNGGTVTMPDNALYIDCTASAVEKRPAVPIFQPGRIVCQLVRAPQPAFSAALVAYVEANYSDDEACNALCSTVPFPDRPDDYPLTVLANMRNERAWDGDSTLRSWIRASRLDGFGKIVAQVTPDDLEKMKILQRVRNSVMPAAANLQRLAVLRD